MLLSKEAVSKNTIGYGLLSRDKLSNHSIYGPSYGIGGIDQYTKLMLHMNGANGSTAFTDSSLVPKTVTGNGNAQISTAHYKFGGSSGYFDGSSWIDAADDSSFDLGSNDFTIDFWLKKGINGTQMFICGQTNSVAADTTWSIAVYTETGNQISARVYSGTVSKTVTSSSTISDTNWHHIAVIRNSNLFKVYIDGTVSGTLDITGVNVNNSTNKFAIGRLGEYTGQYFTGYVDEFRFSNIARWTSNFTPQTSEYTT